MGILAPAQDQVEGEGGGGGEGPPELLGQLRVDGAGEARVDTGLPFFDHMLAQLGKHGGFDLALTARGDLEVDAHHTVEDVGIALGECLRVTVGTPDEVDAFLAALAEVLAA